MARRSETGFADGFGARQAQAGRVERRRPANGLDPGVGPERRSIRVQAACGEALAEGVHSADVILNILARRRDPLPIATIATPAPLAPHHAPIANCAKYDQPRWAGG